MSGKDEAIATQLTNALGVKKIWSGIMINVKESPYNAVGDGTTDDTAAIQKAIDYAISIGKKEIVFPAGTYLYTVLTNTDGLVFIGDGVTLNGTTPIILTSLAELGELKADIAQRAINVCSMPYNADPTGVEDSTAAIQSAINVANAAGGGIVYLPKGTFLLSVAGTNIGRNYGLILKSNVLLKGAGSGLTILKAANDANMDIVISDPSAATFGIGFFGFKVDGNYTNQSSPSNFNIWIKNSDYIVFDDIYSYNPTSWGIRLEEVTNVLGGVIRADHAADLNADGIHIKDSSHVVIDKIIIDTKGDDGLIIEASGADSHDITIGEVVVTAPVTTAGAGRGVLLFVDDNITVIQRNIYNISMPNVITHDCKQAALVLLKGNFYNIDISLSDYGSQQAASFVVGSAILGAGFIKNSKFNISSWSPDQSAIGMTIVNGVLEHNSLDAKVYNPGDTLPGITLRGSYWKANITMDYNPNGDKVSPSFGVDVFANKSEVHASIKGANKNLYFRSGATDSTIYIGYLEGSIIYDIEFVAGANNNRIIGGEMSGTISNAGTGNKFIGVKGGDNYGSASITPNASGNGTIAHGLKGIPSYVCVGIRGDQANVVDVQSVDATNITVRIKNPATNADVTTGTFTIDWKAQL